MKDDVASIGPLAQLLGVHCAKVSMNRVQDPREDKAGIFRFR